MEGQASIYSGKDWYWHRTDHQNWGRTTFSEIPSINDKGIKLKDENGNCAL